MISYDLALALATFALITSITPGPNNLMLMASGANFGFRRTIPHMLGVSLGFVVMAMLLGFGLMQLVDRIPGSDTALKLLCGGFLLYLAWKIANAAPPTGEPDPNKRPLTFWQAAAFQWINPKALAMALSAVSIYAPDRSAASVMIVAAIFGCINLPAISCWAVIGLQIRRVLRRPAHLRAFNIVAALLLLSSLVPILA